MQDSKTYASSMFTISEAWIKAFLIHLPCLGHVVLAPMLGLCSSMLGFWNQVMLALVMSARAGPMWYLCWAYVGPCWAMLGLFMQGKGHVGAYIGMYVDM